jgi:hypothetical protein
MLLDTHIIVGDTVMVMVVTDDMVVITTVHIITFPVPVITLFNMDILAGMVPVHGVMVDGVMFMVMHVVMQSLTDILAGQVGELVSTVVVIIVVEQFTIIKFEGIDSLTKL